ncbi:helix-turn-helix transcriptional regulator [Clostridium sp.]|uniref:helix-turn-helix domain-containing protein n=1 Tax=Clostridium sp. TaxID=1506 RepID=UPI002638730F|nr:helix-turn-helix transcriptional regulator [Clostridium sp.]
MFGNRLKSLRKELNLTQAQLANILKISASTIGMYEQNRRTPDTETLQTFSNYFNVSVDYLIGKTDIKESAEQLLKDKSITVTLHNSDGIDAELPDKARKEIEDFIEYVKHKYKK